MNKQQVIESQERMRSQADALSRMINRAMRSGRFSAAAKLMGKYRQLHNKLVDIHNKPYKEGYPNG